VAQQTLVMVLQILVVVAVAEVLSGLLQTRVAAQGVLAS